MQSLRSARFLARLVLAWFALALGAAIASPLVKPQGVELVCAAGGAMKLVVKTDDASGTSSAAHTLDCPLCATSLSAPPPVAQQPGVTPAQDVQSAPAALAVVLPGRMAAPPPSRGPPAFI